MSSPDYIIEAENITFGYTDKIFLKDVSFRIERGDFAAIIGDNGSGKSTMIKIILGLISPLSGVIRVRGEKISAKQDYSKIGYVPQNCADSIARFPATAEEIVLSSLYKEIGPFRFATKKHRQIAHDALDQVGLLEYRKIMPPEMSGGQRQRLMLARVLACRPEILILDEPTVGIDADAVQQLLTILHQINISKHVTILMVTHDIAKIASYANRVLCLSEKHFSEKDLPAGTIVHAHPLNNDHRYEHVHCANCPHPHNDSECAACRHLSQEEVL
mgnify:CR=1 FL=1